MAKKPTLPPPSAPAKPAPPKPTPPKPTQPPASAGKPTSGKPASGKPAPGKPALGKPTQGGKPVKPTSGATSSGTIAKPGAGSATADPSTAKPVREFKGDTRKPLTPINVRPILDELGNPVYRRIKQRIDQQPDIVEAALNSSRSPDAAFRKLFGTWGRNPEMEAKAIEAAKRNGLISKTAVLTLGSVKGSQYRMGDVESPLPFTPGNTLPLPPGFNVIRNSDGSFVVNDDGAYQIEVTDNEGVRRTISVYLNSDSDGNLFVDLPEDLYGDLAMDQDVRRVQTQYVYLALFASWEIQGPGSRGQSLTIRDLLAIGYYNEMGNLFNELRAEVFGRGFFDVESGAYRRDPNISSYQQYMHIIEFFTNSPGWYEEAAPGTVANSISVHIGGVEGLLGTTMPRSINRSAAGGGFLQQDGQVVDYIFELANTIEAEIENGFSQGPDVYSRFGNFPISIAELNELLPDEFDLSSTQDEQELNGDPVFIQALVTAVRRRYPNNNILHAELSSFTTSSTVCIFVVEGSPTNEDRVGLGSQNC